ncbi:pseudouridine synthase [Acidianus sulfidivorans JP7]|uniref:Pseudouridine synthase n=1 Tax=Acidianus sulfidivorans JP7 TaxID=619593 RepID=A0A2U9IMF7_9CREN|nr:PUA domain-containing protein [Acidianus sulfidivorans]AWR97249.1 pseudouridine synthase [Acidianus sulfidivorans JP7]
MIEFVTEPKRATKKEIEYIQDIFSYQFGYDLSDCVFSQYNNFYIQRSINTNRVRNILDDKKNLFLVLRAQDNLFSLTINAADKIVECSKPLKLRLVVSNEIAKAVQNSGNVFCKHVKSIDLSLRAGDQGIVVNDNDKVIAIGRLKLSAEEIMEYKRGVALVVKERIKNGINT